METRGTDMENIENTRIVVYEAPDHEEQAIRYLAIILENRHRWGVLFFAPTRAAAYAKAEKFMTEENRKRAEILATRRANAEKARKSKLAKEFAKVTA
jgi:hypothetical protein